MKREKEKGRKAAAKKAVKVGVDNLAGLGMVEEQTKPIQQPLFGELDQIVNVLELEQNDIRADISKCYGAIDRKKEEIKTLTERRDLLDAALVTSKKMAKEKDKKKSKGK